MRVKQTGITTTSVQHLTKSSQNIWHRRQNGSPYTCSFWLRTRWRVEFVGELANIPLIIIHITVFEYRKAIQKRRNHSNRECWGLATVRWFSHGNPVSSTYKMGSLRYSWHIVEIDVKNHKPKANLKRRDIQLNLVWLIWTSSRQRKCHPC